MQSPSRRNGASSPGARALARAALPPLAATALLLIVAPRSALGRIQSDDERLAPEVVLDRILEESLARGAAHDLLRSLCTTAPHRLSGSEGAERAVEWARETMEELGFENVRLEPCIVPRWERGDVEELVLTAPAELAGERLPILALGGSVATPAEGVEAPVIAVRSFEELAALGADAAGTIVLFDRPMDPADESPFRAYGDAVSQRTAGASHAASAGALAALVRSMSTARDDVPHTGNMRYAPGGTRVPAAAVSTLGADRIGELLRAGHRVRARLRLDCELHEPVESFNVVGEVVGRELPEEIVVVGGHLDAWDVGEGAHDDGAGCVQAIEALRLVLALDVRPRRTLRCVLFMNEENGLVGGNAYYATHLDEMDRHVLAIESDRGGFTPRGFVANATDEAMTVLRGHVRRLSHTGVEWMRAGGGGADIRPMRASGVPLVGFVPDAQRYFDLHHSANDVFASVHRRELHLGAAAIAGLAWLVAEAEEPLPRQGVGTR